MRSCADPTARHIEPCSVANGGCLRSSNLARPGARLLGCWKCGNPVCANCSLVITLAKKGLRRFCHDCLEALDGNDVRVMTHIARQAGYRKWNPVLREAEL